MIIIDPPPMSAGVAEWQAFRNEMRDMHDVAKTMDDAGQCRYYIKMADAMLEKLRSEKNGTPVR